MNTKSLVTTAALLLLADTAHAQFPRGSQGPQNPHGQKTMQVLMQDGSVRTIVVGGGRDGGIDPRVLQQLRNSGRRGDGYGITPGVEARVGDGGRPAWVNTWAGLDPEVKRLWNMEQNWGAATGVLMYSYQAIDVSGSKLTPRQMFDRLKTFELFNPGEANVAEVKLVKARRDVDPRWTGRQWALFRAKPEYPGLVGVLNGLQEFVNSRWVPVELFYDDRNMTITAVTLGDHMIVGVRRWTVKPQADGTARVETEAWEARNGSINDVAMRTGAPGLMTGKEVMGMVWDIYLTNIGKSFTSNGGSYDYAPGTNGKDGLWRELPEGSKNPFRAGIPFWRPPYSRTGPWQYGGVHPGKKVPPGHYGPGGKPPAPPKKPAVPAVGLTNGDLRAPIVSVRRMSTIHCHQGGSCDAGGFRLSLGGFEGAGHNGSRFSDTRLLETILQPGGAANADVAAGAGMLRD